MTDRFVIMESSASMPNSCKGTYRNIAVIETDCKTLPKMISDRARGCVRIVQYWGPCNVGTTPRSAFAKAQDEAKVLKKSLDNDADFHLVYPEARTVSSGRISGWYMDAVANGKLAPEYLNLDATDFDKMAEALEDAGLITVSGRV